MDEPAVSGGAVPVFYVWWDIDHIAGFDQLGVVAFFLVEEREMLPLCHAEGIGVIPYSPLASGQLTCDLDQSTLRSETDQIQKSKYDSTMDTDRVIIERVAQLASRYGVSRAQIATAWILQKSPVSAPIIGATKNAHLEDAVRALDVKLTTEDVAFLEEPYVPHPVVGAN